ncbi:hypothetical protein QTP70_006742 [Hemibagrus guttatus]|uniref:ribonuclease H n=1 Tax=Hemibagrus guttatus TaxID=175788 RepID=A0AAE0UZD7_9TELE|nr:hypothetical protein QTP70_006742 [Hemibagrus guttatus]
MSAAHGLIPHTYEDFKEVFSEERAARLPSHQAIEDYIEAALAAGHIRPSTSPAVAGFFFVGKKDGGLRPCIDYRGLNAITVRYPYPLPLVPAALEQLRGARLFTKLDLRSAYNLVRIRKGDKWKTTFHMTHGHYEYRVMPFGLTNAPAVFQALINGVFQDLLGKGVIAYINDGVLYLYGGTCASCPGGAHQTEAAPPVHKAGEVRVPPDHGDIPGLRDLTPRGGDGRGQGPGST